MSRRWRPLLERLGLQSESSRHQTGSSPAGFEALPLYSAVAGSEASASTPTLTSPPSEIGSDNLESCSRRPSPQSSPSSTLQRLFQVPTLARFFADFTLGFADGLTVPFALTAGLSSLGHTDTVIYAGMAEICAGSISMGIGGYLAARGEVTAAAAAEKPVEDRDYDAEGAVATVQDEKGFSVSDDVVARYLDPLDLPLQLHDMVTRHIRSCPAIAETLLELKGKEENEDERLPSPLMAGLSVAVGYLLGGMIPLFPYFLVSEVQDGMVWSFVTCAVALFVFGFCKDLVLSGGSRPVAAAGDAPVKVRWSAIRRSAWEGMQMVFLGSVAALAAVALVRASEGFRVDQPAQT